jgi:hypothetical protein
MASPVALRRVAIGFLLTMSTALTAPNPPIPSPSTDASLSKQPGKETAVFAGGCFWGVQSVFQRVKSEGFARQFFVCEWAVTLSGIEECDTDYFGFTLNLRPSGSQNV